MMDWAPLLSQAMPQHEPDSAVVVSDSADDYGVGIPPRGPPVQTQRQARGAAAL